MPIYEYKCHRCGQKFEVRQRFSEDPLKTHEACGGEVERLISAPALHFKGSGWYVTDYAKNGKSPSGSSGDSHESHESKDSAKSDSKAESKAENKSEGQSESKPETKTESKTESKSETSATTK
jgi:putative FmdB family regulatory protein